MNQEKQGNYLGVATLFEKIELKRFFSNYIYFIIGTEILIFLVSFLGNIGPDKGPFPWKFYFYVSFTIPIAITFLLGVFILAFNYFIFGNRQLGKKANNDEKNIAENKSRLLQINSFLIHMNQAPFLPMLFGIILGSALIYKLDTIFLFIFNAGEKVVTYIIVASGAILLISLIFGIVWVVISYRLSKKQMEHEYNYRNEVMDKLGVLIMHDNTVISKDGKIINKEEFRMQKTIQINSKNKDNFKILPPS